MKKILVPTDFSVRSLKLAAYALKLYHQEIIDIILVYPYRIPLSDSELYGFSPRRIVSELKSEEFLRARNELVHRFYVNIGTIQVELFTGLNSLAFQNFTDRLKVHTAVVPQKGFLDFSQSTTFDPLPLIQKNIPEIHRICFKEEEIGEPFTEQRTKGIFSSLKSVFQGF